MKLFTMASRNVFRNGRRSAMSAAAIATAALASVLILAAGEGLLGDLRRNTRELASGDVRIRHRDYEKNESLNPLPFAVEDWRGLVGKAEASGLVDKASPRIGFGTAVYRDGKYYEAWGIGVDIERELSFQPLRSRLIEGRIPGSDEAALLLGSLLAREMDVGVGDRITLWSQTRGRGTNAATFSVAGILRFPYAGYDASFFLAPLPRVDRLLRMEGAVTEILFTLKEGIDPEKGATALASVALGPPSSGAEATPWTRIGTVHGIIEMFRAWLALAAVFVLVLSSTVIANATMMTVFERRREIGTLAALGMPGRRLVLLFLAESAIVGATGSFAGCAAAAAIVAPLSSVGVDMAFFFEGMSMEFSSRLYPALTPFQVALAFAWSTTVASLASLPPSLKAARTDPAEAIRTT